MNEVGLFSPRGWALLKGTRLVKTVSGSILGLCSSGCNAADADGVFLRNHAFSKWKVRSRRRRRRRRQKLTFATRRLSVELSHRRLCCA